MFVKLFIRAAILSKYVQSIGGCKKEIGKMVLAHWSPVNVLL